MQLRPFAIMATAMFGAFMASSMVPASYASPEAEVTKQAVATSSLPFAASRVETYTVQPGNTLSGIAWRFHTSIEQLVALNHLANPNLIRAGEILRVVGTSQGSGSSSTSPTFATSRSTTYTVRSGNTLSGIASAFHTSISALVSLNHLANPNQLRVGQVLLISGSPSPAPSSPSTNSGTRYTVKPGNTLSGIAAQFRVSWQAIAAANRLSNPNALEVGEVLTIPASGSASSSIPAASARTNFGQALVNTALSYLGAPYVWGGTSPAGFDCSGLVQYVFARNGVSIPRTSWAQYAAVNKIAKWQLQPGDLVFFSTDGPGASHVGLYIGSYPALGYSQAFVEAPEPGLTVRVSNLDSPYYESTYYGAGFINP
jgi:peptidoglycan endopeptidase LytE